VKEQKVSIAQVAKKAGVSSMTVSRVIRGEPFVREDTRKRVVAVMKELGYVPSAAAQSLRSHDRLKASGTRLFALIFGSGTESSVSFFFDVARGVEQAASEFGLCPLHVTMQDTPENSWLRLQTVFSVSNLCGALLAGQFSPEDIHFIRENVKNVVVLDGPSPNDSGIGSVESGNLEGALLAIDHLINIGCRRILVITVERKHYFAEALTLAASSRRSPDCTIEVRYDCFESLGAHELVLELWKSGKRFDGLFTSDDFAIGAMKALQEMSVAVPGEVKIIGFDDITYSSLTVPSLTSIRIDKYLLGAEAVRTLVAMTRSPEKPTDMKKVIRPTLIVRESTGGPTPAHPESAQE
jgi:LacI family transcriptional regulator